ncbi:MAG: NifB/NifX family molybdenum-iron cluster-binding protein [Armatimonadetes bacterium]|nr:NifB/NifX family molybdenum-iron cluster-binding protein [Armatimonadota bacterium]
MKIAITRWGSRVAPLFDTARVIFVIEVLDNRRTGGEDVVIDKVKPYAKPAFLQEMGVELLICDGISEYFLRQLAALNIRVIHSISGEIEVVVKEIGRFIGQKKFLHCDL